MSITLGASTGSKIKLVTSSGADIDCQVSYTDYTSPSTFDPSPLNVQVTTATTTDIIAGSASAKRGIRHLSFRNIDGSVSNTLTVKHTDGSVEVEEFKAVVPAGYTLQYDGEKWLVYDTNGGVVTGAPQASDTAQGILAIALQADQETGTSTVLAVTPGRQHFHPSACKFWVTVTGAGTPAIGASYNVTSVADTNTGRMTVTIANDFSSANWSLGGSGIGSTTVTSAAIQWGVSKAAGSIELDNADLSATPVAEDPTVGYDVQGFGDL